MLVGKDFQKISSNVWVSTSVHQQNQFPSRMMSQCQHCQTLRNLTWLRKKVKTHSSIGIAFSSSSLFCDSRIDLCRWSYVKLFGLYMHHDSEVSSHGSRTYLIVVLCSKICKKEEKRKSASRCRYLSIWRFLGIILLRLPRLPWEESSESWCI